MDVKKLFPRRLREFELYNEVIDILQNEVDNNEAEFLDVINKFTITDDTKPEVVQELLFEKGLSSLYELISLVPNADINKLGPYLGAIVLMKGRIEGYKLVLDLLNFDYDAVIWYLQSPKGLPHTISLEVSLESSEIEQPYFVFQKIKLFTQDYIYPIIFPLGYNYDVSIDGLSHTARGKFHPNYDGEASFVIDNALLLGNSRLYLQSPDMNIWDVRVSNTGIVSTEIVAASEPSIPFRFYGNYSGFGALYVLTIDNSGDVLAVLSFDDEIPIWEEFYLPDNAGNPWQIFFNGIDLVAPIINSVIAPVDSLYLINDVLSFTVNMSEDVYITGTPRLAIQLDTGIVYADYTTGSGSSQLTFEYTIVEGDNSANGITLNTTLDLNGGSIEDLAQNDAVLTFVSPDTSNIDIDGIIPSVTSLQVPTDGLYLQNDNLDFIVTFDDNVTVTGTPRIEITFDTGTVYAECITPSGTQLTFRYTVISGDNSANGIILASSIDLNLGDIQDSAGYTAYLNLPTENTSNIDVDGIIPFVTSVTLPADGYYTEFKPSFNDLQFTVNFNEIVNVGGVGTPRLEIILDSGTVYADYVSGSGSQNLVFLYDIQNLDLSLNGITVTSTIDLNGGTITDNAGYNAILTMPLGDTSNILVDAVAPTVVDVTIPDGSYMTGQNLDFTVTFSEDVIVSDPNTIRFEVVFGTGNVFAEYISGTGTSNLVFRYVIDGADFDDDGITILSPIQLINTAVATDAAGNSIFGTFIPPAPFTNVFINYVPAVEAAGVLDTAWTANAVDGNKFSVGAIRTLKIQADDKLLVGGNFTNYSGTVGHSYLVRLNVDGTLDTSFMTNITGNFNGLVRTVFEQADGKILVGGDFTDYGGTVGRNYLVRLNSDGTLDTAFCTTVTDGPKFNDVISAVIETSDLSIVVLGKFTSYNATPNQNQVLKFNSGLTLDSIFMNNAVNGNKFGTPGSFDFDRSVVELNDGSFVIGGCYGFSTIYTANIVKVSSTGVEDSTFSTNTSTVTGRVYNMVRDNNNKIFVATSTLNLYGNAAYNYFLKINSDGTVDTTFMDNAVAQSTVLPSSTGVAFNSNTFAVSLDSSNNIYVGGGFTNYFGDFDYFIRLEEDLGYLDLDFAIDVAGTVTGKFSSFIQAIAEKEGVLYVGGQFTNYDGTSGRNRLLKFT